MPIQNSANEARARMTGSSGLMGADREDLAEESPSKANRGQVYPLPSLESVTIRTDSSGEPSLASLPTFRSEFLERIAGISQSRDFVFFSLNPELQTYAHSLAQSSKAPHVAIVAMDPSNGRVLAMADRSDSKQDLSLYSGFPAASVFKIVTSAAALEKGAIEPDTKINFRGGTYTLNQWNYVPDSRRDRLSMSVSEALGKSCNPVFGRIGLRYVGASLLSASAQSFGFGADLRFNVPLEPSTATIPFDDYGLSRTSAGFGAVTLSPVHAAALAAGLAHHGLMPKPILIDKIISPAGAVKYQAKPEFLKRMVSPDVSQKLLNMMEYTTTMGTSRHEFMRKTRPVFPGLRVAAKTGTLKGTDPEGITNWFVAAAPIDNPALALAVVVVNPGSPSGKASHLGRLLIQKFFGVTSSVSEDKASHKTTRKKYSHYATKKKVTKYATKKVVSKKAPAKAPAAKKITSKKQTKPLKKSQKSVKPKTASPSR